MAMTAPAPNMSKEANDFRLQMHKDLHALVLQKLIEMRDKDLANSKMEALAVISANLMVLVSEIEVAAMVEGGLITDEGDNTVDTVKQLTAVFEKAASMFHKALQGQN